MGQRRHEPNLASPVPRLRLHGATLRLAVSRRRGTPVSAGTAGGAVEPEETRTIRKGGTLLRPHRLLTRATRLLFCLAFAYLASQILNHTICSALQGREGPRTAGRREAARAKRPAPPPRRGIQRYALIAERNIFNSEARKKKPAGKKPPEPSAPGKSPLDVILLGTATGAPGDSFAVLYDPATREQDLYQIDDFVKDEARIVEIDRDRVLLQRGDDREVLEILEPDESIHSKRRRRGRAPVRKGGNTGVRRLSATTFAISEERVEKSLENINRLMTQIRVVPSFQDGRADGFKVFAIKPRSIFAQVGLRNGDIIRSVNDRPISDPARAFKLLQDLRDERDMTVEISRRGRPLTLNYEIR